MLASPNSLKGLTLGLLGLLTVYPQLVSAQREYTPYPVRCGRPHHDACAEGQYCAKGDKRWTCQPDDYKHTATVTLGCPPVYEPTSTPTYEPPYTPAGAKCGRPKDKPCSEGYVCAKNKRDWKCRKDDSAYYQTTITVACSEPSTPPGYEPPYTPPVYEPTTTTPDYEPTSNPPDYEPTSNPPDYESTTTPDYEPTSNPPDYESTTTPDYESTSNPPDYESTTTPDYESTSYPPDYESTSYPPDYEPTSYPPTSYPPGYEPTSTSRDYESTTTPGYETTSPPDYDSSSSSSSSSQTDSSSSSSSSYTEPPSSSFTPVVGVPGRVVDRRPIQVLQSEYPDVFNMFVLAMAALQARDEDIDISWYQVSGIHGYPFIPWQYPPESEQSSGWGYCTHRSRIFNTWHRPYIILLEQLLHEEGMKIAEEFAGADREKYLAAADDIRFPYWDWASDDTQSRMPSVVTQQSISVTRPGAGGAAETAEIPNPLYSYRFLEPQAPGSGLEETTVRRPNPDEVLFATFEGRKAATHSLFAIDDFDTFNDDSESIHDGIHVNVGEDMGSVPTAAFDPIFWLHHCAIDRLVALYQATHPGAYLTPGPRQIPTFGLPAEGTDDMTTPLYPFRHPSGNEWTSDDVKDVGSIWEYGYSYPETPQGRSESELIAFTTERINELYGPDTNAPSFAGEASGVPEEPNARLEWSANVIVNPDELPGSYRILLYVGEPGANGTARAGSLEDLAGVAPIFSGPNSAPGNGVQLNVTVPLTPALVEKQVQLNPEDTVPSLVDRFYWYVERVDTAEQVPVTALNSLQVAVVSTVTEYSEDNSQLPVKKEPQTYYAPTEGKPGGIDPAAEPPVGEKAPAALDEELPSINNTAPAVVGRRARLH